ncbi:MAG: endo-1,4-beta-xylanase [Dysgonamonadaceae bacterium]|jgi:endo-1,4-beta-xylanase|nr:endo-1,4-beta-xylanase [Dysgonamonadaceae bacterium]
MKSRKTLPLFFVAGTIGLVLAACSIPEPATLKDAYSGKFLIGAAINTKISSGRDTVSIRILKKEFNSITAENCMKSENLQPEKGAFHFDEADRYVKFGEENGMAIIGHCLIWHSQTPKWFFTDENGQDVSREELIQRMKDHIITVVSRYRGRIKGWDVVNEAILDDGSWRNSKFYRIIGEDFVKLAFEFAREADPDCELYYNDYSMSNEGKRIGVVNMVKKLQAQGVKVDGIGMQGHCGLQFPDFNELEKSLTAFAELGCKVNITELDFSVLPSPDPRVGADVAAGFEYQQSLNPYSESLPDSIADQLYNRYKALFGLLLKHANRVDRVTLWGITDDASWRNDWPISGRTDYALLFDRNYQSKPVVKELIELARDKRSFW